jgi:hypothetical protein
MAFLPLEDQSWLSEKGLAIEEVEENGQKGVVLKGYPLPDGKFDASHAEILVLLPQGYPEQSPDMFFTIPKVRLLRDGSIPRAADVDHSFGGRTWQRWSRHATDWTPGSDGIWTMFYRIKGALEAA